jgi:hypothetical protein
MLYHLNYLPFWSQGPVQAKMASLTEVLQLFDSVIRGSDDQDSLDDRHINSHRL